MSIIKKKKADQSNSFKHESKILELQNVVKERGGCIEMITTNIIQDTNITVNQSVKFNTKNDHIEKNVKKHITIQQTRNTDC